MNIRPAQIRSLRQEKMETINSLEQRKAATPAYCRAMDAPNSLSKSLMHCPTCGGKVNVTRDSNANYVVACCGREFSHAIYPRLCKIWNQLSQGNMEQCLPNGGTYGFTPKGVELWLRRLHIQRADIIQTAPGKLTIVIGHLSKGRLSKEDFDPIKPAFVDLTIKVANNKWLKGRKKYDYKQYQLKALAS